MTDKELARKAVELADKEAQERQVDKIKHIVQTYLESINRKNQERRKLDDELRILKSDLDDIKSGRLDRIKERQEKEPKAREISPIIIKIIKERYEPMFPWRSPWIVEMKDNWTNPNQIINCVNTGILTAATTCMTTTGTNLSNFAGGTYIVGSNTVMF